MRSQMCSEDSAAETSKQPDSMNEKAIQQMVDTAIALHREIAAKTEQLKGLKANLIQEARSNPKAHMNTESGGKRWTANGSDGSIARVSFPAVALMPEIEADQEITRHAQLLAGDCFRHLFRTVKVYELASDFREQAAARLPAAKAKALIKLCEVESAPRVSFETAKRPEPEARA